jgi:hypothetical protein
MKATTLLLRPAATLLLQLLLTSVGSSVAAAAATAVPVAFDPDRRVAYQGLRRNGIEVFLNIPYGQDTGGANRFRPPLPREPEPNSTVAALAYGPACPQQRGPAFLPGVESNVTDISEDCLNLNVARPQGARAGSRLPVLVWIYGGGFFSGQNRDASQQPDGLILQAVDNGSPVVHVAINYRLGGELRHPAPFFFNSVSSWVMRRLNRRPLMRRTCSIWVRAISCP